MTDKAEKALADLTERIREAHGVLSDLRREMKAARQFFEKGMQAAIDARLGSILEEELEKLHKEFQEVKVKVTKYMDNMYEMSTGWGTGNQNELANLAAIATIKDAGGVVTVKHGDKVLDVALIPMQDVGDGIEFGIPSSAHNKVRVELIEGEPET